MPADLKSVRVRDKSMYATFHAQGHRCLNCGATNPQAAHLLRGKDREDLLEAVVPLCFLCHPAFDEGVTVSDGATVVGPRDVRPVVAAFLRSDAGADQAAYLIRKLGAFGAEAYVQKLEAS